VPSLFNYEDHYHLSAVTYIQKLTHRQICKPQACCMFMPAMPHIQTTVMARFMSVQIIWSKRASQIWDRYSENQFVWFFWTFFVHHRWSMAIHPQKHS